MGLFSKGKATKELFILVAHPAYAETSSPVEVESLIGRGADVNALMNGTRPLCEISVWGNANVAAALLTHGADPNGRQHSGWTPLHIAALNDHVELIELLVQRGADVNARGNLGDTPLHLTVTSHKIQAADQLLSSGADPNATDATGSTPLRLLQENAKVWRTMPLLDETQAERDRLAQTMQKLQQFDALLRGHGAK